MDGSETYISVLFRRADRRALRRFAAALRAEDRSVKAARYGLWLEAEAAADRIAVLAADHRAHYGSPTRVAALRAAGSIA